MNRYLVIVVVMLGSAALVLVGCVIPSPTVTPVPPTPRVEAITTTAQELDPSAAATAMAGPRFDIPEDMYLLLEADASAYYCYSNCACPEPNPGNWSELSSAAQNDAMREMLAQGTRVIVDLSEGSLLSPCSCGILHQRRYPVNQLPFEWTGYFTIYRVECDGTVTAKLGETMYQFAPGDTWSYRYTNPTPAPPSSECFDHEVNRTKSVRNAGLLDANDFLLPSTTPAPPFQLRRECGDACPQLPTYPGMEDALNYVRAYYPGQALDDVAWQNLDDGITWRAGDWVMNWSLEEGLDKWLLINERTGFRWEGMVDSQMVFDDDLCCLEHPVAEISVTLDTPTP